jgi:nitrogen fixation protein FixH
MKKSGILAIFLLLFFVAGVGHAKDYEANKKVDGYDVTLRIDKSQPVVGDNTLTAEIKDSAGNIVKDATVKADYSMPAMPGMPPMNYKAEMELKGSLYTAKLNLSMSGSWNIAVKITRSGKTSTVRMTVDAR